MEEFEHKVKPIGPAQGMIAPQDASVIHRHLKLDTMEDIRDVQIEKKGNIYRR